MNISKKLNRCISIFSFVVSVVLISIPTCANEKLEKQPTIDTNGENNEYTKAIKQLEAREVNSDEEFMNLFREFIAIGLESNAKIYEELFSKINVGNGNLKQKLDGIINSDKFKNAQLPIAVKLEEVKKNNKILLETLYKHLAGVDDSNGVNMKCFTANLTENIDENDGETLFIAVPKDKYTINGNQITLDGFNSYINLFEHADKEKAKDLVKWNNEQGEQYILLKVRYNNKDAQKSVPKRLNTKNLLNDIHKHIDGEITRYLVHNLQDNVKISENILKKHSQYGAAAAQKDTQVQSLKQSAADYLDTEEYNAKLTKSKEVIGKIKQVDEPYDKLKQIKKTIYDHVKINMSQNLIEILLFYTFYDVYDIHSAELMALLEDGNILEYEDKNSGRNRKYLLNCYDLTIDPKPIN